MSSQKSSHSDKKLIKPTKFKIDNQEKINEIVDLENNDEVEK